MPVIVFTSKQTASENAANCLIELGFEKIKDNEWQYKKIRLIDTNVDSVLDVPTNFNTDYLIVLSSHKSKNNKPALTAHFPGNWNEALLGGNAKTLNIAYASKLKIIMQNIKNLAENERFNLGWDVTLEVDHHGPTCDLPIIYVEIGCTEKEWNDKHAGKIIAEAVLNATENEKKYETVFGIGCGHYPKEFNKIEFEDKVAMGHILPKYHLSALDNDLFRQAIEKNVEKVNKVYALKDKLNVKEKKNIKELCNSFSVEYIEL